MSYMCLFFRQNGEKGFSKENEKLIPHVIKIFCGFYGIKKDFNSHS